MDIYKKGPGCLMISDRGPFALRRLASVCGSCVRIFEHIFACEKGCFCRVRTVSSCVELGFFVCGAWFLRVWSLGSSCVELLMHVVAHGFWPNGVAVAKVGGNRQRAMVFACPL